MEMPYVIYAIDEELTKTEPNSLGVYSKHDNPGRTKYHSQSKVEELLERQKGLIKSAVLSCPEDVSGECIWLEDVENAIDRAKISID